MSHFIQQRLAFGQRYKLVFKAAPRPSVEHLKGAKSPLFEALLSLRDCFAGRGASALLNMNRKKSLIALFGAEKKKREFLQGKHGIKM